MSFHQFLPKIQLSKSHMEHVESVRVIQGGGRGIWLKLSANVLCPEAMRFKSMIQKELRISYLKTELNRNLGSGPLCNTADIFVVQLWQRCFDISERRFQEIDSRPGIHLYDKGTPLRLSSANDLATIRIANTVHKHENSDSYHDLPAVN